MSLITYSHELLLFIFYEFGKYKKKLRAGKKQKVPFSELDLTQYFGEINEAAHRATLEIRIFVTCKAGDRGGCLKRNETQ